MTMTFTATGKGIKNEEMIQQRKEKAAGIGSCQGPHSSLVVAETLRAFSNSSTGVHEAEGDDDDGPSQVSLLLSQGDEQIRQLDNDGSLNMVVGSQSVLSQELHLGGTSQPTDEDDDDNDGDERMYYNSQLTETSIAMAERLGVIPLSQEENLSSSLLEKVEETQPPTPAQSASAATKLEVEETQPPPSAQPAAVKLEPFSPTARKGPISDKITPIAPRPYASSLRDTPIRNSECFGSLLDAVQILSEQEEMEERNAKLFALQNEARVAAGYEYPPKISISTAANPTEIACRRSSRTPKRKAPPVLPAVISGRSRSSAPSPKKARKAPPKSTAASKGNAKSSPTSPKKGRKAASKPAASASGGPKSSGGIICLQKARKSTAAKPAALAKQQAANKLTKSQLKKAEQRNAQEIAQRAAELAERTVSDPEMAKNLLLSMALVRENPRSLPSTWPPRGSIVPEGFFWAHYPPLEGVLKKHMAEYYELSTTKCQSAQQQTFNNELVIIVKEVANEQGWKFHKAFNDKSLRDRIRCYYKTHIQNAKKRLRTMLRNPTKKANARHLCVHLDLIEQHNANEAAAAAAASAQQVSAPVTIDAGPADGEEEQKLKEVPVKKETNLVDKQMIREKEKQARLWAAEEDKRIARVKQQKEAKEEQLRLRAAQFEAAHNLFKENERKEGQDQTEVSEKERIAKEEEESQAAKIMAAEEERISKEKAKIKAAAEARLAKEKAEIEKARIAREKEQEAVRLKAAEKERIRLKAAEEARIAREKELEAARLKAAEEEKIRLKAAEDARIAREKEQEAARLKVAEDARIAREKEQEAARLKATEEARIAREKEQEAARLKAAEEAWIAREKEQEAARVKAAEEARIAREKELEAARVEAAEKARIARGKEEASRRVKESPKKSKAFTMKRPIRTMPIRSASSCSKKPSQPPPTVLRKSPRKRSKPAV